MSWDPRVYHKFKKERSAPFEDLSALIAVKSELDVIDLGCGTGELTEKLAGMLPGSRVLGIDSSPDMLAKAAPKAGPGLRFEDGSIENIESSWDLVFSNAAIQWVSGHRELIPRLVSCVRPGGQLAVQLPSNHSHITQLLIGETAGEEPFRGALGGWVRQSSVLSITEYAELLHACGCVNITVFEKVFPHVLEDVRAVADWLSGTMLLPYFERLPDGLREGFLDAYIKKLEKIYPPGPVFYPFKRIFLSAFRPAGLEPG